QIACDTSGRRDTGFLQERSIIEVEDVWDIISTAILAPQSSPGRGHYNAVVTGGRRKSLRTVSKVASTLSGNRMSTGPEFTLSIMSNPFLLNANLPSSGSRTFYFDHERLAKTKQPAPFLYYVLGYSETFISSLPDRQTPQSTRKDKTNTGKMAPGAAHTSRVDKLRSEPISTTHNVHLCRNFNLYNLPTPASLSVQTHNGWEIVQKENVDQSPEKRQHRGDGAAVSPFS
ncbi:hypothetical protein BaRGS_00013112, partial [Batillaria attramentaria]